jgi:two-component system, cell cycle response regulator
VVLLRTTLEDAHRIAQAVRALTEQMAIRISGDDQPLKVTVSIGVAHIDNAKGASIDALLQRADDALYQAKSTGRNRVKLSDPVN